MVAQVHIRPSSPTLINDNNNASKKDSKGRRKGKEARSKDRDSPPPGTLPRTDVYLARSTSRLSCESEGQFIPEDRQALVSTQA